MTKPVEFRVRPIPKPKTKRDYTEKELQLISEYKRLATLAVQKLKAFENELSLYEQVKRIHDKKDAAKFTTESRHYINSGKGGRPSGRYIFHSRPMSQEELKKYAKIEQLDTEYNAARMASEQRWDMLLKLLGRRRSTWGGVR